MNQETVSYLTNIVIGVILAVFTTLYWRKQRTSPGLVYWVVAAWVMTAADVLFAMRPWLPHELGRFFPPLSVTAGLSVLLCGAQHTAKIRETRRLVWGLLGLHALGLVAFLFVENPSYWRMMMNSALWAGLSLGAAWSLRQASPHFWSSVAAPASAFLAHSAFHVIRLVLAVLFEAIGWSGAYSWLQVIGDLEVSFFMVALFVGLLVANLQLRHEELMSAQAEVQTLSGLLPICAWCKNVRDDEGYWEKVEDYFGRRSGLRFTHGVCVECARGMKAERTSPR